MRTKHHKVFLTALVLLVPLRAPALENSSPAPPKPDPADDWKLVWSDEFEKKPIDLSKWNVEDGPGLYNNELQYYAPDEVLVKDGALRLRSRHRHYRGRDYTSGKVTTRGKFSQTYGKFEVRARLPKTKGIWPAHWLLPEDGAWPPEIDITELLGHDPRTVHMSNHYGTAAKHEEQTSHFTGPDYSDDFHTFAVEWQPRLIRWLVDGQERFRSTQGVPDKPFYLILNTAVGGEWPGKPDDKTVFPQFHDIDYVRVYRRPKDAVPPTVRLTSPKPGVGARAGENVELVASVSDADPKTAKVEFFDGAEKVGEATAPPFRVVLPRITAGAHSFTARLHDAETTPATSAAVRNDVSGPEH